MEKASVEHAGNVCLVSHSALVPPLQTLVQPELDPSEASRALVMVTKDHENNNRQSKQLRIEEALNQTHTILV